MASQPRPVNLPDPEYSTDGENLFRRQLEDYLLTLSSEVSQIESGDSVPYSLSSKRNMLMSGDLGQEVIPDVFTGSEVKDFGSMSEFTISTESVSCVGATAGMFVDVSLSSHGAISGTPEKLLLTGHVETGGDAVLVVAYNFGAGTITVPSGTLSVRASSK